MILEGPVPAVEVPRGGGGRGEVGGGGVCRAGCRLQPNFNEHRGEYSLFLFFSFSPPIFLRASPSGASLEITVTQTRYFPSCPGWCFLFWGGGGRWWWGGFCNCVILQRTCSVVLIEQMICQFVMFIFKRGAPVSTPCSAQPPHPRPPPPHHLHLPRTPCRC